MAYIVNKSNPGATPNQFLVQDSIVNEQTDLTFVGKGYAGYGEIIAENFLHLLENFSSTSAPTKPIKGQLWYDEGSQKLKVYSGTSFAPAGGATYASIEPSNLIAGDLWIDSDTQQLFFHNGATSVLVGPPASTGTLNGFIYEGIVDSSDNIQNISKWYNDDTLIATVSDSLEFTPKIAIPGFPTIKQGITLHNSSGVKINGTATDADGLNGQPASSYLRTDGIGSSSTTRTLAVLNDSGFTVGLDSDLRILLDASGVHIQNQTTDADIIFRVNDGGTLTTVMTLDGATSRVGIGTINPTTKLDVAGTINATSMTATDFTGVVYSSSVNLTASGTIVFEGSSDDAYETTLTVTDPTADRTITLPNRSGTVITSGDSGTVSAAMLKDTVTLQILNSSGVALKTIYGAGS